MDAISTAPPRPALRRTQRWDLHWYRFMLQNLVLADFRVRYRNMSLGILWSLLNPLVMMAVLAVVFTHIFPTPRPHFAAFILIGLLPYNFLALCLNSSTTSIVERGHLVRKLRFPRMVLPVAIILSNGIHYLLQLALLLTFVAIQVPPTVYWLWLVPLLGLQLMVVIGACLVASALDVYYRDVRYLVESGTLVLFWLTPIFYSLDQAPRWLQTALLANPLTAQVTLFRQILLERAAPPAGLLLVLAEAAVSLILGLIVFHRLERGFADAL
jgi:ABC-type polysaccharide/polyol phosphate export permease